MAEDLGERSEDATPKRMAEAREEGNVPKSPDLSSAAMLLVVTIALWMMAMRMLWQGKDVMSEALLFDVSATSGAGSAVGSLRYLAMWSLRIAAPIILIAWAAAVLAHLAQVGWLYAPRAATPSFRKLNPLNGLKRLLGVSAAVKSGMDLVKVVLIVAVAVSAIMAHAKEILVLPYLSSMQAMARVGSMMFALAMRVLIVLLCLGLMDFLYQKWKHREDLKMTKQQVKDEMRQSEGDPEVKRRRIRAQRAISMQRISAAVPKADVIVTNPEHISVAIQYDAARMNAPKVVAKGADFLAMRIRQIAMQHGIPIVERKPLARALYKQVQVNQEVPPEFYKAVAEILAYVYRLSGKMAG